jgi:rhodanese-related sulfurtransferase
VYCYLDGFPGWQKAGYPVEVMKEFLPSVEIPVVPPAELKALLDGKKALVVDIRDTEDRKGGSLKGELFIPLEKLMADHGKIPKETPIVIVDLRGAQTPIAGRYLVKQGFPKVSRLDGGFEAWVAAGLPVEK